MIITILADSNLTNKEYSVSFTEKKQISQCQGNRRRGSFNPAHVRYEPLQAVWQEMALLGWTQTGFACQIKAATF